MRTDLTQLRARSASQLCLAGFLLMVAAPPLLVHLRTVDLWVIFAVGCVGLAFEAGAVVCAARSVNELRSRVILGLAVVLCAGGLVVYGWFMMFLAGEVPR